MSRIIALIATLLIFLTGYLMLRNHLSDSNEKLSTTATPPTESLIHEKELNFHEWREFSFRPEHFKVLLPSLPQHVSDTVIDPKTQEPRKYETFATAGDSGSAFMINAISFSTPNEAEAGEESLKGVVNEMMDRNKENKLNEMKMSTFHGAQALDFSLSNGDLLIEGKVIAHKKTMYILSMINKKDTFNKKELNFFINSFDFVDDQQEVNTEKSDKQDASH